MLRTYLFILLGAVSFAAVYMATEPAPAPPEQASSEAPPSEPLVELVDVTPPRQVRDVTPGDMTAGPTITGALARVEPEEEAEPEAGPPSAEPRIERIFNPVVESAGLIMAGDREIRLAGIDALEADATCGESAWPCGTMARAALRRFIRGRAIECGIPAGAAEIPDPAVCSVAGEDISEWLVAQGWAEATIADHIGIEMNAREEGLGRWGANRPDVQEDVAASEPESSPESALAINSRVSATP
jgi:endonuclease YncB( thermonuclease family)